ncbi:MAG: hypothetical protein ACODAJ_05550, partial [Planctomycetota bacterium]
MEIHNVPLPDSPLGGASRPDGTRRVEQEGAEPGTTIARSATGDSITISPEARQAILVDALVQRVLALPEARPDVVAAAQDALARGDLDTQDGAN